MKHYYGKRKPSFFKDGRDNIRESYLNRKKFRQELNLTILRMRNWSEDFSFHTSFWYQMDGYPGMELWRVSSAAGSLRGDFKCTDDCGWCRVLLEQMAQHKKGTRELALTLMLSSVVGWIPITFYIHTCNISPTWKAMPAWAHGISSSSNGL